MTYLIDTNIISETAKKNPNKGVIELLGVLPCDAIAISVITIGEIKKGIELRKDNLGKIELINWLEHKMIPWFENRILPINYSVAERWGYITANTKIPAIDGLIAATALVHNLILVTRNTQDFIVPGLEVVNPFI